MLAEEQEAQPCCASGVLGALTRFGEIGIVVADLIVLVAVWKLTGESGVGGRGLFALLGRGILHRTFHDICIFGDICRLIGHRFSLTDCL